MTLSEVLVAALILGISSQASLQGWSRSLQSERQGLSLQDNLHRLDRRVLATQRVLAMAPPTELLQLDGSCRFAFEQLKHTLAAALPAETSLQQSWQRDGQGHGVWLQLSIPADHGTDALERRLLFTPAGLGLCAEKL